MKLLGEKLYLRPVALSDVGERYHRWMNDPEVTKFLEVRFSPQSLNDVRSYVEKMISKKDEPFFAICVNETHEHIGNIKLGPINPHHKSADVSLVIGEKSAWGKGFASEAIGLVTEYAFKKLALNKLKAGCYSENEGSARAFEKCGWQREGLLRGQAICDGKETDVVLLGIKFSDYKSGIKNNA
ncbi:MAG: GNAT family protein [Oligoflexia bacterium]|nr:GNAT family protein [Oligoflexia bacterium]